MDIGLNGAVKNVSKDQATKSLYLLKLLIRKNSTSSSTAITLDMCSSRRMRRAPEVTSSTITSPGSSFSIPQTSCTGPTACSWTCWMPSIPIPTSRCGSPMISPTRLRRWRCARCCALAVSGFGTSGCRSCAGPTRAPRGLLGLFGRFCRLVRGLRAARPRLVYCTTSAALLGAPAARLARVPRVVGHFQEVWSGAEAHILAGAARACHLLVANSEAVTNALPPDLRKRTVVVPNGTPEPDQRHSARGPVGRSAFPDGQPVDSDKGLPDAIRRLGPGRRSGAVDYSRRNAPQRGCRSMCPSLYRISGTPNAYTLRVKSPTSPVMSRRRTWCSCHRTKPKASALSPWRRSHGLGR